MFVYARCRLLCIGLCCLSVDAWSRVVARFGAPCCNGVLRGIAWRVYVFGVSLCQRLFVVAPLVAWLRVRWLCVASPNVIASRSGGLASVAFCMYSLCARRDLARVFLGFWVVNICVRLNRCRVRVFDVILVGIRLAPACGAAEAFPASSPGKKKKRGCRRLVIIRDRDGAATATVPRELFRTTHRKE